MDLVLGLSMTSSSVRWVLVEGTTGDGATLDRGSLPTDTDQPFDAETLLSSLFDKAGSRRVHAIGLTWTGAAEATASAVWQALTDRQVENVIAVSDLEAAEALTCGIADIAGYERVVVCVVEPGGAVVASVTSEGVTADRVDASALGDVDGSSPDAVFVVGSGDVAGAVATLERSTQARVISADEADLALARGSALAAASAVLLLDTQIAPARRELSRTATLVSVLAAAVVTFVISLSVALGLSLVPDHEVPSMARSEVSESAPVAPAKPARAAPLAPKSTEPRAPEAPAAAEPVAVAVPVPDAALIVDRPEAPAPLPPEPQGDPVGPPGYIPPAPAYVPPPAPPNYLPPAPAPAPPYVPPVLPAAQMPTAASQQQPRLRDRIIDRIPLLNRLGEPDPYGQ